MVMETMQIRMNQGLIQRIDALIKTGIYANRSDAIRDAVRRLVLNEMIGIIEDKTDSVEQVRNIRKKLSKREFNLKEVNELID